MKVMVIGADGQLGTDLCPALKYHELIALTQKDIEITDMEAVFACCRKYRPRVIINTASLVKVDDCEDSVDLSYKVNALGARNVAVAAQELGAVMVQLSTDYVFGGDAGRTVPYTEFDEPAPLNVYGQTKLAGERMVQSLCTRYFIIRTSSLFGIAGSLGKGGNFVETVIKLAGTRDELQIVDDQVFSPTYAVDLAAKIVELISTAYYGIIHITNNGTCSWYEFGREALKMAGVKARVVPVKAAEYPRKARRPAYSVLGHYQLKLLGMDDLRDWHDALRAYMVQKGHLKSV